LSVLDFVLSLGCAPGAVSVSLSCDDAVWAVLWGGVRRMAVRPRSLTTKAWRVR